MDSGLGSVNSEVDAICSVIKVVLDVEVSQTAEGRSLVGGDGDLGDVLGMTSVLGLHRLANEISIGTTQLKPEASIKANQ